ncbi:unnamed protein product [Sphagnum compactum]
MDPEQTFLRVHARLSGVVARLLTPKFRSGLEYFCLCIALFLLALLVVMHVNFVAQPGCAELFSSPEVAKAELLQIKIVGSWNHFTEDALGRSIWMQESSKLQRGNGAPEEVKMNGRHHIVESKEEGPSLPGANTWSSFLGVISQQSRAGKASGMSNTVMDNACELEEAGAERGYKPVRLIGNEGYGPEVTSRSLSWSGRGSIGTALLHHLTRWSNYVALCLKRAEQSLRNSWKIWVNNLGKLSDPTYLYSVEKAYLLMTEGAKFHHGVHTVNISISAQNACFGSWWQQLLIDNIVGYDTILMNSLLNASGRGYLYNFQTKDLYNLNYLQEFGNLHVLLLMVGEYVVFKCGVLITSLFVFFTTTMSVSFTLRETQARMLNFTVQLQHHARHHLPTYRLIFLHVVESLVFVPIMIGILFFLFEFFDDQLLAFMVLTLVWLCELFTMISVRTSLSMQYFPRFFFLYFMVFHIYFFSYTYGFSYLALLTTAAFMQHLILYFWNHFEIPALQTFLQERALLQHQQLHITSSAILTSTVHMTQATNLSGTARALARTDDQSSGIYDAQMGIGFLDTQTPSGSRGLTNLSNSSIESSSPLVPGVTMESPDLHTSRAQFDARISNWINNVIHETGSSDRSTEMDAVDARSQREREHDRGRGTASRFRLTGSEEVTSPSAVLHSSFMAFGSVVPWMLGSPSLFLSLFRETGNPITRVESSFNPELGNPGSTSSTTQQGIISTSEERLRQQVTGNRSGESQNC